uniref:Protein root hair defective 3-like n=1 Tax=Tanacetum cinerariifolium TaxID=118510 RepID=A0A6L2LGF6_TANCI|nr:protein root hair defective 3-like [Tanacetum cinerariifolium]
MHRVTCFVDWVLEHASGMASLQMGEFASSVSHETDTYSIREPLGVCDEGDETFNGVGLDSFNLTSQTCRMWAFFMPALLFMSSQSSEKSTLLNHLFHTNFMEMDAYRESSRTTKGIWIAICPSIEPSTIVMDLEDTSGREHGEDETTSRNKVLFLRLMY